MHRAAGFRRTAGAIAGMAKKLPEAQANDGSGLPPCSRDCGWKYGFAHDHDCPRHPRNVRLAAKSGGSR
jgi:hypothetical protein